ncbi:hypothetical protein AA0229_1165 [Gluconobacter cerinus NRIC 0229]|nr:hypothetical protein AA0229_1165 [Gluconobacter cerinus NRIC 0229]
MFNKLPKDDKYDLACSEAELIAVGETFPTRVERVSFRLSAIVAIWLTVLCVTVNLFCAIVTLEFQDET